MKIVGNMNVTELCCEMHLQ